MVAAAHQYEIFIHAPRERVWEAIVDPDMTIRYFHGTRFESSLRPGEKYRYVEGANDVDAVEGSIEIAEAPHRLVMTWQSLYDDDMATEPPSRVEWTLTPANADGSVTRVSLRHGELALSPRTWEGVRLGWVVILDTMKTLVETGDPLPPVEMPSSPIDVAEVEGNWHRAQAITANNSVWELLGGDERSADQAAELLERAYAAAHHWRRATGATVVNQARAAWLVSRAHAELGHGQVALEHADRATELTERAGTDAADFDRAYAHEARARALACLGRLDEARLERKRAERIEIADEQDRAIFTGDLAGGPWFGLAE